MAIDIEWVGLVKYYLETGDLDKLEAKIRSDGVPKEFGNEIADLLTEKLRPLSPAKRRSLENAKAIRSHLTHRSILKQIELTELSKEDLVSFKKLILTNQRIADILFPHPDRDYSKRTMNRIKKRHNIK